MTSQFPRPAILFPAIVALALAHSNSIRADEAQDTVKLEENQVLIETTLISIDPEKLQSAAIAWDYSLKSTKSESDRAAEKPAGVCMAKIEKRNMKGLIEKLEKCGGVSVMRPTMITGNGRECSVQTGGNHSIPIYRTLQSGEGAWGIKERRHGMNICFVPSQFSADRMLLDITLEFSRPTMWDSRGKALRLPVITGRTVAATVELGSREALVLSLPVSEHLSDQEPRNTLVAVIAATAGQKLGANRESADESAALRDEISELRQQVARLSEKLATRNDAKPQWLPARTVERAVASEPVAPPRAGKKQLITKVYAVADLVVPVPDMERPKDAPRQLKASDVFDEPAPEDKRARAEFAPLVEMITSSIEPASWENRGGAGAIHAFEKNLSLVISQTAAVHEQIAELLQKLRRLQDHVLQFEISLVSATREAIEKAGLELAESRRTLPAERAERLLEALQVGKETRVVAAPRVALLNKQLCDLETRLSDDRQLHLVLCGSLGDEFETIRFNLAVNPKNAADAVRGGASAELQSGETLVLDVTDRVGGGRERGVPVLEKIPHVERLFKNVRPAGSERMLLFISPRVLHESEAP